MSKLKKYSFFLWIIAAIVIFIGANKIYRYYTTNSIIEENFGNKSESKTTTKTNEDKKDNNKPEKNDKGMPLVPNFTLKNEKNQDVSLADFSGKVVILNFWASWCPPCKAEMPEFKEMNDELKNSKDVVLLTINLTDGQRETKETALKFLEKNKYDFTVLFDVDDIAGGIFGVQSIPTTVIIDKEGYLHNYIMGATSKKAVLDSVKEVK